MTHCHVPRRETSCKEMGARRGLQQIESDHQLEMLMIHEEQDATLGRTLDQTGSLKELSIYFCGRQVGRDNTSTFEQTKKHEHF